MTVLPLFLSDVGGSEIVLILLVILMFFGSKSIPGIARTMGKTMHQIKQATQDVQNEIKKSSGDLKADFDLQKMVRETTDIIEKPLLEESVKMDQIIQTPTQFSKPFGIANPSSPAVTESSPALDQPVEEPNKDLAQE
ncbi:twin-arginine translocase TatA/TatE family subunit [Fluviicola taffensis]|uniref:twin-arginine translocase TatA/TatE family subunit n=1 Tax=Fluviicola taffensis TaxID=191579 RepID=UPI0031381D3D